MGRLKASEATAHTWQSASRIYLRWQAADGAIFRDLRSSFRSSFSRHCDAIWLPDQRAWSLPLASRWSLLDWLYQHFEGDAVREDGAPRSEWAGEPRPTTRHAPVNAAYATLHLLPSAPLDLVQAAYRLAAQTNHPDRGGSNAAMAAVNQAVAVIRDNQRTASR